MLDYKKYYLTNNKTVFKNFHFYFFPPIFLIWKGNRPFNEDVLYPIFANW